MEMIDPAAAARVWQRVGDCPGREQGNLRPLLLGAWECASVYRAAARQLTGPAQQRCRQLHQRAMESLGMLKGLQLLRGEAAEVLPPQPVAREPARRMLEKRYYQSLAMSREYMARTLDPETGTIWQALADREGENRVLLTQILGSMEQ